jgi:hypothetical protein
VVNADGHEEEGRLEEEQQEVLEEALIALIITN